MDLNELIERLLEVRAESQRGIDLCRAFEKVRSPENERLLAKHERNAATIDLAIVELRAR